MTDNRMTDRVSVTLNGMTAQDIAGTEPPLVDAQTNLPNQALHVLTIAQRTADEHLRSAHQHAEKIRAEALAAAEEIAHEAEMHAASLRREADKVLAQARAAAGGAAEEAQVRVEEAQRNADRIVSEARAAAEAIGVEAAQGAEELRLQAQRRYDDVVGSLEARREALQQQIEALERFDHEYRARLTAFMQGQLRALWVDQPQVTGELDADAEKADGAAPTGQSDASSGQSDASSERPDDSSGEPNNQAPSAVPAQRRKSASPTHSVAS